MPYNNLPFLGLNDDKYVHNAAPAPPAGREATGTNAARALTDLAAPAARLVRRLHRSLRRHWSVSGELLGEQEAAEFNLLTQYVNSTVNSKRDL